MTSLKKGFLIFSSIFLFYLIIILIHKNNSSLKKPVRYEINSDYQETSVKSPYAKQLDLSEALEPWSLYQNISCQQTKSVYSISVLLCLYDSNNFFSEYVRKYDIYEPSNIALFVNYLIKDLNLMVIDIGSNLGVYTLFASKLERDVLSVEPFEDNILRFRKAVKIQALEKRIILLNNLVYNKPGIVKRIGFTTDNYGNQIIQKESDDKYQEMENKFLVKSIVMDDLINFLPINPNTNKVYEKAILKIDIEGFEAYAFQSANNLLKSIDIRFIFMEWTHVKKAKYNTIEYTYLVEMVGLLKSNGYKPYTLSSKLLELGQFQKWNINDVLWKKEELKN